MSETTVFALGLLSIGILFILIGVFKLYRQKNQPKKDEELIEPPKPSYPPKEGSSSSVMDKMKQDSELLKKIRKVIDEKKEQ